ncbi:MAG: AAA family ATPase [Verrucomicrobiota bacterium]|nr:AAA family ATPase [Verrucomicrobiota bacterium]
MNKRLTTSVYTFKDILDGNFLYIDKTKEIYDLIQNPKGMYFLSRPRRFGKSLMLSTFKSIFSGDKELFKGLYIYEQDYDWKKYPIINLNLGNISAHTAPDLERHLNYKIDDIATLHKVELKRDGAAEKFEELINILSETDKVVILIDEYDKPILSNVLNDNIHKIKETLKGFYSVIKTAEPHLRFSMMTGVSKFSKVSIFSELNNLDDLTMNTKYSTMLGFTQNEVESYFKERIAEIAEERNKDQKELIAEIKEWYNGYRLSKKAITVYNPVSLTKFMMTGEFDNYWFETGTPTFLLELMRDKNYDIKSLEGLKLDAMAFSAYEVERLRVEPLLFQTGYATIVDYNEEYDEYTLSYPNREVKNAFLRYLVDYYTPMTKELAPQYLNELQRAILANDIDKFMKNLNVFFANIDYDLHIANEKYYQTIFYLVFALLGVRIKTEIKTNKGRIDAVIETDSHIYIFEFKLFDSADSAIKQIKEKQYYRKYELSKKKIILVGVAFDKEMREMNDWKIIKNCENI